QDRCYECHGEKERKGDVNLKKLDADPKVGAEFALWEKVRDSISEGELPPAKANQLSSGETTKLLAWLSQSLDDAANAQPGDPEQVKAQVEQALYVLYQHKAEAHLPKDDEDLREADYMLACWKWRHRDKTGASSLAQLAKEMKLSQAFLENWWNMLSSTEPKS